ncbi:MAG TPA: Ig-like domain-containing protein [Tepidisphaeraceae bacterium]|nr:Ig-like domain-containing protein [Tepidisphaeraceae bacterium]
MRYLGPTSSHGNVAELEFDGVMSAPPPSGNALTGAVIGTPGSYNNSGNTIAKAFDGSLSDYFDAQQPDGAWAGMDLGAPAQITQIKYAPRSSFAGRMVGGIFQGSNTADFSSGVVNLYTVTTSPAVGSFTTVPVTDPGTYRYVRYLGPTSSHGNVAEIEFDGVAGTTPAQTGPKLIGTAIGSAGSGSSTGPAKAFDFSFNTAFDASVADFAWTGIDTGGENVAAQIKFAPRSGQAARMVGGIFQGSDTADFSSGVVNLYTVPSAPTVGAWTTVTTGVSTPFRYLRYIGPTGSHGDVAEIEFDNQVTGPTPNPSIRSVTPINGATAVARNAFVSCDLNLPNLASGIDVSTLNANTVQLFRTFDHQLVDAAVNTDGAGSVVVLQPFTPLDASTTYTFVVNAGLKDALGATFQPFSITFTTGSAPITTDPNIAFEKVTLPTAVNQMFTGVTMGPDDALYASTLNGHIFRFPVNTDGTLGNPFDIQTVINDPSNAGGRLITGISFDPTSTASNMTIWVSSGNGIIYGAPDFTGKMSTISGSGTSWGNYKDMVIGLPRSSQDHLNNQPVFGPDGALYWGQGSNSAMGAPDPVWGLRQEHLLNAAILRLDVTAIRSYVATNGKALNVQTDSLPAGQTAYNPFAAGAALTLYATGVRNDYDLVFDSNGHLYAPTNGSAAGGNVPATPAGVTPSGPALNNVAVAEDDWLFDIQKGGYYGHPNPSRNEFIMNGGNPTTPLGPNFPIQNAYPVGTNPDPNYRGVALDLGVHYSPDGALEYHGSAFNGALDHAILATRYSGGKDLLLIRTGANGQVTQTETGIAGFTGFNNPIDVVEDPHTGFLYVAELGGMKLTLLRPINSGAQVSVSASTMYFNDPVGGSAGPAQSLTITNTGSAPLALPSDGLTVTGADGSLFPIVSKPSLPATIPAFGSITITLAFNPASTSALGLHTATLEIKTNDPNTPLLDVNLRALATAGLGGNKEPSLQRILDLYQIPIQTGTADPSVTAFTTPPGTPNDEVVMPRLVKAGTGPVTVTPLAVFSASITPSAGFGYYTAGTPDSKTEVFNVGTADAQSVHVTPIGATSFDPGSSVFGLYSSFDAFPTSVGTPRIAYSEDEFNTYDTSNNNRKVRFYPLKNSDGSIVPNAFIFATEDYGIAPSYDSNDVVGIIRNVQAAPVGPELGLQNQDGAPFVDRLALNDIQNSNATHPNVFHNKATVRVWNTGDQAMMVNSITSSNAGFTVGTFPSSIAANSFADVVVTYLPTHTGNNASDTGTLTISTNAINGATRTVQLDGFWQLWGNSNPTTGAYTEPSVSTIINLLGYKTTILNSGQNMNQGGKIATVGEEVLSNYWVRADTNLPVSARQLASFHTQGNQDTLYWFSKGSPTTYNAVANAVGADGQSFLPQSNDTTHAAAFGTFSTNNTFGFNIDKQESSDDSLNNKPTTTDQGHHLRFWPARDRSGNLIPNTWLMSMDYAGINYDYNDNVFLISNMRPAPPAAPTTPVATGSGSGISLTWTAVSAPLLAGYNVYRSTSSTGTFVKINSSVVATASDNDATAAAGSTYYYKITATDTWGCESAQSAVASATRPADSVAPAAPAGLTATGSSSGVTLSWTANIEADLAGYNVYRSTSATGTFFKLNTSGLITGTNFVDTTAPAGQASFYQVTAVDASSNESTAATANATRLVDTTPPAVPTGFSANGSTANITLSWSANTDSDLAGYNLYRSNTSGGALTKLNSTPLTALSFVDTAAQLSLPSYYQLRAVDTSGNESAGTAANAVHKDSTLPAAPANLNSSGSSTAITLTWAANTETDLAGYRVYRATSATGTYTLLNTTQLLSSAGYVDSAALSGVASFYHVTAVDFSGNESSASSTSATRTGGGDITPPAQPTGFIANGTTSGVNLSWTANTESDLAGYNVYSSLSPTGTFTIVNKSGLITTTSYADTLATASVTTYYHLTAVDKSNNESSFATTQALRPDTTAPSTPKNFTATGSIGGIALSWTANTETDLAGYNVYRAASAAGPFTTKINTSGLVTANSFNDTSATVGATNYYQIKAVDTSGNSSTPTSANAFRPSPNDITPPAQPSNLAASGAAGGITLTWSANTEPDLAGYNVYSGPSASGPFTKLNTAGLLKVLTYNDTAAVQGATTFYRLSAVDLSNNESTFATASALRPDATAPATPANFTATGSTAGIALAWNANTESDLAGYNLYSSTSATGTFTLVNRGGSITGTSYNDTAAPSGAVTFYHLTAVDTSNNESTTPANANALRPNPTDTTPPATPTNFGAVGSAGGVSLTWSANTEPDLAGYNLYRAPTAGGTFVKLNTTGFLTGVTYNDTTAPAGQMSFYQLTAVDTSANESTPPATASASVPVQSTFTSADIGNPPIAGSTTTITPGSDYDMAASGANINGTADQFRYVYKQVSGDFDVKVQIASLSNGDGTTSGYARAGIMVRTDLSAGSANLYTFTLAGPFGFITTDRPTAGATTTQSAAISNNPAPQKWVRMVRVGDTYTTYASIDGTTWNPIGPAVTVPLGQTVYLGMAATSHQTDHLVIAKFRSFTGA